ncbi:muts domain V-domain-containing protein [Collybia nuda]|uniref:DNA mismatch repair protein MSH3 n=1 Tax=Collybia nuda TaxID=64659 RepID=A0A9P5YDZ1_9AGAR|nr:muts domain V-domain-containing protein [Collybia nuda]
MPPLRPSADLSSRLETSSGRQNTAQSSSRPITSQSRPWTAQSRPTTARPLTSGSVRHEGNYVIALLEGRGIGREIGMAAINRDTGKVMLADCQTYVKTLHQMHLHSPSLILIPDTFISASEGTAKGKKSGSSSLLVDIIQDEFPGIPVEPVGRKYWNDSGGLEFILQLCVEDDERAGTILAVSNKYYALSATCALFKYAESRLNIRFAAGSLRICYVPVEGTMMIDPDTARNLELVENMSYKKSAYSLFGTLNHTYTPMAARLLRVNLLSPLTVQATIDARLDVVEEFIQTEDRFSKVRDALKTLNKIDFDKLIISLASEEVRITNSAKPASARILQMINIRNVVKILPLLRKALDGCQCQMLTIIQDMVSDERLAVIDSLVSGSLNENGAPARGGIGAINARVYAVKANRNRLLDVARETYKENVGDIFELNRALSENHELPLSLLYQDSGFVFTLKKSDLEGELPKGFINVVMKKGKWMFSTIELKKMNARMKDALDETLILSDKIVQDLVAEILASVGALYKASEAVALLDMLWSFAHSSIIRPEFTGTLAIKSGRHPVLESVQSAGTLVPNDVYCDDSSSFQIVQGPKFRSGKSTYLRQIGLLAIMAVCGCFVPAEYASFRIHDSLLTRLSNDDDMERNLSTFASEMATSAMILGLATPSSLILIDELGRGTSPREGVGVSHAIAEGLIALKSFVFFTTHFSELTTTLSRQPTVINLHLSVHRTRQSTSSFGMSFQYKIVDGAPEDFNHYGLELARLADLPESVLIESKRVAETLSELHARQTENSESSKINVRRKALLRLRTQLTQALDHSTLPDQDLLEYIRHFQTDIAKAFLTH